MRREVRMINVVASNVRLPTVSIKGIYHMPRTSWAGDGGGYN
jgi:hypothetical protein